MTITADRFEVFGDATFVASADRFDDVLAQPRSRDRDLLALTALAVIPPSDLPAFELPDYEPTIADLLAIELEADEDHLNDRIAAANTMSAVAARHTDLLRLHAELPASALIDELDETDLERAA